MRFSVLMLALAFSSLPCKAEEDPQIIKNSLPFEESTSFDHQWKSGMQTYQLKDSWLTQDLLTIDGLQLQKQIPINEPTFKINDRFFQPASFHQDAVDQNSSQTPIETAERDLAANFPVKSIEMLSQELQMHQEAIKADDQISESVRSSRMHILTSASESLKRFQDFDKQRERYSREAEAIESERDELKKRLEVQVEPAQPEIDSSTLSDSLSTELKTRQDILEKTKRELEKIESAIEFHTERVIQIPIDRARAEEKRRQVKEIISKNIGEDLDSQITQLAQELELRALEAELKKLDCEERRQEVGAKVDPIHRDLKLREVKRLEAEVTSWEKAAQQLRDQEVARELEVANEKAANAHWSIESLADRNAALVVEQKEIVEKIRRLKSTLDSIAGQSTEIVSKRTEIEKKIEAAGLTATNGMLLVELRRNLMTTGESHIQIRKLQHQLREVSLSNVGLQAERDELADPASKVKQIINTDDLDSPLAIKAKEFLTTKRDYLDQLIDDYQSYGRLISEVSLARKKLIEEINQTMAYIDKNAIWIRSSAPARLSDFKVAKAGLAAFCKGRQWYEVTENIRSRMWNRMYESAIAVFSLALLAGANRRFRRGFAESKEI